MMKKWRYAVPAVTLAVVAGSVGVASAAYAADEVCDSDLGSATIDGNLTVPSGADCVLGGATVTGDIIVEADGWLDATSVVVGGSVIATDAYGVLLDGTSVSGDVVSYSADTDFGFLYVYDLEVGGNIEAGGIDVEITDSTVAGSVSTQAASYVDFLRTSVAGDVSIDGSAYGVTISGAIVQGDVSVSNSQRDVLIGALADGSADAWGNSIGGSLNLTGNSANLQVAGTTAYGSFVFADNDPAANLGAGNKSNGTDGDHTGEAPGEAGEDPSISVTIPGQEDGELWWTLEGTSRLVDLGVAQEQLDHFLAEGEIIPVRIQDTRAGNPSWSFTAQVSDFAAGGESVPSSYLGWTPRVIETAGDAVAGPVIASGFDDGGDGLSVARTLASALEGHERGESVVGAELELKLPLDTPEGTYSATITLTALG